MKKQGSKLASLLGPVALLASLLGVCETASAQCPSSCNQSTHHWNLGYTSGSESDSYVGMANLGGTYYPAMCNGVNIYNIDTNFAYSSAQLTQNTSFCTGGGNDKVQLLESGRWCYTSGFPVWVEPFDNNQKRLTISGESGNDSIELGLDFKSRGAVGDHALCGGSGNDTLYGGYDYQYVSGGGNDDRVWGGRQDDNVRGNSGNDTVLHPTYEGRDKLRGEAGNDCIYAGGSTQSGSSCGDGADKYQSNGSQLSSCETAVSSCF